VLATPWDDPRWAAGYDSLMRHGAESVDTITAFMRLQQLADEEPGGRGQGVLAL
jgi:hypothetical protein